MDGGTQPIRAAAAALVALALLAACVTAQPATRGDGTPVVRWLTPPGHADFSAVARGCSEQSDGAYEIEVHELPADILERRNTLIRRLTAADPHIDVISLDTELTPEFAASGLLRAVPENRVEDIREDAHPDALASAEHDGTLYAVPFIYEPQILWFRSSSAQRAGLNTRSLLTLEEIIEGAARAHVTVQIDDVDGRGTERLVRGLIASVGGAARASDEDPGFAGAGANTAATLLQRFAQLEAFPEPGADTAAAFASTFGGFAISGPSLIADPAVQGISADIGWASYPAIDGEVSAPLSGLNLAVTSHARLSEAAVLAVECLTARRTATSILTETGHMVAYPAWFEDEELRAAYPLSDLVLELLESGSAADPSVHWSAVDEAITELWSPLDSIHEETPAETQRRIAELVRGEGW